MVDRTVYSIINGQDRYWIWTYVYFGDFGQTAVGAAGTPGGAEYEDLIFQPIFKRAVHRLADHVTLTGKAPFLDTWLSVCLGHVSNPWHELDPSDPTISPVLSVNKLHWRRNVDLPQIETSAAGALPLADTVPDKIRSFFRLMTSVLAIAKNTTSKVLAMMGVRA